jgi:hypothetical protein
MSTFRIIIRGQVLSDPHIIVNFYNELNKTLDMSFQRKLESTLPVQFMDSSFRWNDTRRVSIFRIFAFFSDQKKWGSLST